MLAATDYACACVKLKVDVSAHGTGAAFLQGIDDLVCYCSKKAIINLINYSTNEKEISELLIALQHFELSVDFHPRCRLH